MMNDLHVRIERITIHNRGTSYASIDPGQLWINLITNAIGRQILGQLMSVSSLQYYCGDELNAYLSLVFVRKNQIPAYAVCLHFKVDCCLLKQVNEDIGNRIFDVDIAQLARNHLQ